MKGIFRTRVVIGRVKYCHHRIYYSSRHVIRTSALFRKRTVFNRNTIKYGIVPLTTLAVYQRDKIVPWDWILGFIGGGLLGGGVALFLLVCNLVYFMVVFIHTLDRQFNGRVAGLSGLTSKVADHALSFGMKPALRASASQMAAISGLLIAGTIWHNIIPICQAS